MLIGSIAFTEDKRGIRLYDVDGTSIHLALPDVVVLSAWITRHASEIEQAMMEIRAEAEGAHETEGREHGR